MVGLGTIANVVAVLAGGIIGLFLKNGMSKRFHSMLMHALGISVIFIGVIGAAKESLSLEAPGHIQLASSGILMLIVSMVLGSLIGEALNIERGFEKLGAWIKKKIKGKDDPHFVDGFVTTSLVICVGAMAIVGSLQDGLRADPSMLYAKSLLDLSILIVFASTLGKGSLFAALPLGIFQGSITAASAFLEPFMTPHVLGGISLVGSVMICCVGINILFPAKLIRLRVANMLPALVIVTIWNLFNIHWF
ncbi:MAG: DUF554 domain-containing protein [Actinomycetaceae bacterium]|nr:DUF554 domain-containing protein [Actinomycetaceae bacterium]